MIQARSSNGSGLYYVKGVLLRMKRKISLLSLLLVAALVLGMMPFGAFRTEAYAATAQEADVDGSKKIDKELDKKALDPDNRDVEITLSLPSAEYKNEIDIVFVMDTSSSAQSVNYFISQVKALFERILEINDNLTINVGVVKFRGKAFDAIKLASNSEYTGLLAYDKDDSDIKDVISDALALPETALDARGTNIHGGLRMAQDLLESSTVKDEDKYVVLLTDGRSYIWNDENDTPTTYYTQWYEHYKVTKNNASAKPNLNQKAAEYDKNAYPVDVLDPEGKSNIVFTNDYSELYSSNNPELTSDTGFEVVPTYVTDGTTPSGQVVKHEITSGPAILFKYGDYKYYFEYQPDPKWVGVQYYQLNPYLVDKDENGVYYFTNTVNPSYYQYHIDNQQKALYKAGHLWAEMGKVYNCAAITAWDKGNTNSGLVLAQSFATWLPNNSQYGVAAIVNSKESATYGPVVTLEDDENAKKISEMFTGISNDILYMVASGTVTDPIPAEFDLKLPESGCPFTIETEKDGALEPSGISDNKWGFGLLNESADGTTASTYKYEVEYKDNVITWTINVPVENANKVSFTYTLTIKEGTPAYNEKTGELISYPTNGTTVLNYVSTDGDEGEYNFTVPEVTYAEKHLLIYHSNYPDTEDESQLEVDRQPEKYPYVIESSDDVEFTVEGKWTNTSTAKEYEFTGWNTKADGSGVSYDPEYEYNGLNAATDDQNNGQNDQNNGQNDAVPVDPTVTNIVGSSLRSILRMVVVATSSEEEPAEKADLELYAQWEEIVPPGGGGSTPKTYTVTYRYTGTVPAGAPSVPATKSYTAGAAVPSAGTPSMEGYTFSGWSGEVSVMPSHDVTVTGSWTPVEDPGDETDIDDPDTPLAPAEIDDETDIDDPDTPLAPAEIDDETDINEEPTPLSPFTGDNRHTVVWTGVSVVSLAAVLMLLKRRKAEE